jgi:predicted nucleotidyltransferase
MGQDTAPPAALTRWVRRLPVLLRGYGVREAYLFGSWARDDADALSDVDLMLVAPSTRPFVERFRDYPALLDLPGALDLLVYTPEEFRVERRRNRFVRHALRGARRLV